GDRPEPHRRAERTADRGRAGAPAPRDAGPRRRSTDGRGGHARDRHRRRAAGREL
ncbi:MAG: hypothetical protein AVDCRST_MAG53-3059, partial [uncultured Solirubrobacteraceae bacterium]